LTDAHNPDVNPNWTPLMKRRVLACVACGAETTQTTNHTGIVPAERCTGRCRTIINPHTAREVVSPYYGPHRYVRDEDDTAAVNVAAREAFSKAMSEAP